MTDDDEFAINNQEDLDENIEDIKEFIIYLEDNEINDLSKKSSKILDEQKGPKEEKDEHSVHSQNLEDNDEDDFKIDIKVDLDMSDKEIENILNSQIKPIPEGNNKMKNDIPFDKEKYEKELNEKYSKAINDFQNVFENKISTIVSDKKNLMKSQVSNLIENYSKNQIEELKTIKESTIELQNGLADLIKDTEEMNDHMTDLNDQVAKDEIKFSNLVVNNQDGGKGKIDERDFDDKKEDKLTIKFEEEIINREETIKECNNISIENIKIINIGNKTFRNLYFVKDENESSEDFIFYENNQKDNLYLLKSTEEFSPNQETTHSVGLKIKNPKSNKPYKLIIYVRETENGPNLSGPLQIIINVKEDNDDSKIKEEQLFNELNNEYNLISIKKEKILDKIKEVNYNKEEMSKWIKEKIDQEVNKLYEELIKENNISSIFNCRQSRSLR